MRQWPRDYFSFLGAGYFLLMNLISSTAFLVESITIVERFMIVAVSLAGGGFETVGFEGLVSIQRL